MIHKTAIIHPTAELDSTVSVGAYSVIEEDVRIDKDTVIEHHAIIKPHTTIGCNNKIYQFSSIGEIPQDLKFNGEKSQLIISDNNIFREFCTINRGTEAGINKTVIGSDNLFMSYTHVAHDCVIKDNCIFSNAASLAGHVEVGSHVSLGGFTLVHQFCNIGDHAFSGLGSVISRDVTPYTLVAGNHARAYKINTTGLKRSGMTDDVIQSLEKLFKLFVKSKIPRDECINTYNKSEVNFKESRYFVDFILKSVRGITR
tara:strand:+ start:22 stop:792 length:771 start_codon:yes stop_codon:yes gene_type:complete